MTTPSPTPEPTQTGTPAPSAQLSQQAPAANGAQYTQADVDRLVGERLAKARTEAETAALRAREQAEEDRLKAAGEWRTIAEERAARLGELESIGSQYEADLAAYKEAVRKHNKAKMADWPQVLREAIPHGDEDDPLEVARAIESHRAVARQLAGAAPAGLRAVPGNRAGPRPAALVPSQNAVEEALARKRADPRYLS